MMREGPPARRAAVAPELAVDDERGALFVVLGERQLRVVIELGVHVESGRANADRRARPEGVAGQDPQAGARSLDERERRARVVLEVRRRLFLRDG
jgi:hypothetical protein